MPRERESGEKSVPARASALDMAFTRPAKRDSSLRR